MMTRHQFNNYSYNEAYHAYESGRWTDSEWRAYRLAWEWCAVRFSSNRQERCYNALGHDALIRRRARAQRLANAYAARLNA